MEGSEKAIYGSWDRTAAANGNSPQPEITGVRQSPPDGSQIVFLSGRSGPYNVWIMGIDGSDPDNSRMARAMPVRYFQPTGNGYFSRHCSRVPPEFRKSLLKAAIRFASQRGIMAASPFRRTENSSQLSMSRIGGLLTNAPIR
jgi:hypothetical protein